MDASFAGMEGCIGDAGCPQVAGEYRRWFDAKREHYSQPLMMKGLYLKLMSICEYSLDSDIYLVTSDLRQMRKQSPCKRGRVGRRRGRRSKGLQALPATKTSESSAYRRHVHAGRRPASASHVNRCKELTIPLLQRINLVLMCQLS